MKTTINVDDIYWLTAAPSQGAKRIARWQRTIGVEEHGEMWVPAVYAGNERAVVLCMSPNSQGAILRDNHVYVRASWMLREYPKTSELLDKIRCRVREITDRENDDWLSYCLRREAKNLQ